MDKALSMSARRQVIFVHLPKCAGTAVTSDLSKYFLSFHQHVSGVDEITHSNVEQILKNQLIVGHFTASDIDRFLRFGAGRISQPFLVTFMRDPIERCLSAFQWYRGNSHPLATIEDFVLMTGGNHITTMLAGDNTAGDQLSRAKRRLMSFQFIGFYETLQKDYEKLCQVLNIPLHPLPLVHASPGPKITRESLTNSQLKLIVSHNEQDQELYQFAKTIGSATDTVTVTSTSGSYANLLNRTLVFD